MGKTLSTRAAQQIGQVVRDHRRSAPGTASRRGSRRPGGSGVREGILQADLDAASSEIDGATTADLKLLRPDPDNAGDLKLTDETIEVTNRSTSYSAAEGDYIQVERLNNEWRPRAAGGGANEDEFVLLAFGGATSGDVTISVAWGGASLGLLVVTIGDTAATILASIEALSADPDWCEDNITVECGEWGLSAARIVFGSAIAGQGVSMNLSTHTLDGGVLPFPQLVHHRLSRC